MRRRLAALHGAVLLALALLTSACPLAIGQSVEQRPIVVQTFGTGPRVVLVIGGLHTGGEDNTRVLAEQLATYFDEHPEAVPPTVTLLVVASANPDGTARGIHTNANGVDLNRNWPADDWVADACHPSTGCRTQLGGPSPLSEPETRALYQYIQAQRPDVTIILHSEAALVEANEAPGAEAYARTYADAAGYPYIDEWMAYEITGELIDALEQRLGLRAFDVELSQCCVVSGDDLDRNLRGLLSLLAEVERAGAATPTPARSPRTATPTIVIPDL